MYRKRRFVSQDPYEITAKFESSCAETGKTIQKGDKCIYYPSSKKVYHLDSKTAEQFRLNAWNKAHEMPDADW